MSTLPACGVSCSAETDPVFELGANGGGAGVGTATPSGRGTRGGIPMGFCTGHERPARGARVGGGQPLPTVLWLGKSDLPSSVWVPIPQVKTKIPKS